MRSFRFAATNACLTYPQCDEVNKRDLYDFLLSLRSGDTTVDKVLLASEAHKDGNKHFHAYIRFKNQPNIRDPAFFDYNGRHPNVQPCRTVSKWIKYVTKDDTEPLANFEWNQAGGKRALAISGVRQAIKDGKSFKETVDIAIDLDPSLFGNIGSVEKYYYTQVARGQVYMPLFPLESFSLTAPDRARMFFHQTSFSAHDRVSGPRMRSLWFVGASWLGKTSLARSLGKHWYITTVWHLDELSDECSYGVIDEVDISWESSFKKYYKTILGCQKDTSFTDKYRAKKKLNFGMPVIACSNELPVFTSSERDWLNMNVTFYKFLYPILPNNNPHALEIFKL